MCLAVPAQIREKSGVNLALVDVLGVTRTISLDLVPETSIGDWVLIHAGFAIEKVDEQFANETLELIRSIPYLNEDTNIFGDTPEAFTGTMPSDRAAAAAAAGCAQGSAAESVREPAAVAAPAQDA